jgi:hypothetical protein
LENLDAEVNVNKAWETIRDYIKISAEENVGCYELKKNKAMLRGRMLKIKLKKICEIPVVTGSEQNTWG